MSMFIFMILCNLISLSLVRKHYLMSLICLEFIFITLYNMLYLYLNFLVFEANLGLIYLILGVVESSLGLSLLVYMVRKSSLFYINSFNMC